MFVYVLTDGQREYVYDGWKVALEHIRQSLLSDIHPPQVGDDYYLEIKEMSREEYDALPEQ